MTQLQMPMGDRGLVNAIAAAHGDGRVSILDAENGDWLAEREASKTVPSGDHITNVLNEPSVVVSIECSNGYLATCTNAGLAIFTEVASLAPGKSVNSKEFELPPPISVMRMHPTIPNVIAFGGKENDLQVWAGSKSSHSFYADGSEAQDSPCDLWSALTPIWQAKNVKNDDLDLRVPVWISDLAFLPALATSQPSSVKDLRIVTSTRFQQLRIYETKRARRPTTSAELCQQPISQFLLTSPTSDNLTAPIELILTDSAANVTHVDLTKQNVIGSFKGFSGSVNSLTRSEDGKIIAAGGMDGYLRAFDASTHTELCSIYIGRKILSCLILPDEPVIKTEDGRDEDMSDIDDDDLWQGLDDTESAGDNASNRQSKRPRRL